MNIHRYRILREIGKGGNGHVYLTMDEKLAVVRVLKKISLTGAPLEEQRRQQLVQELYMMKELSHPFIPKVMDIFTEGNSLGIVMEFVEGMDLRKYILTRGTVDESTLVDWALQIGDILQYLHGRNPPLIHRDLKPSNLILHPTGKIYLIDFGIAGADSCTQVFRGTPGYAAPEQQREDGLCDERTDIYGLGRTLFFCGCGDPAGKENCFSREMYQILRKSTEALAEERYGDVQDLVNAVTLFRDRRFLRIPGVRFFISPRYFSYLIPLVLIIFLCAGCYHREASAGKARKFVERAAQTADSSKQMSYYREALNLAPWLEEIYSGIADDFILPNHFTTEEAVKILNLLDETDALHVLKNQNEPAYARFCYDLGIGYYYQMGDVKGKQESVLWFERALETGSGLSQKQKKRAGCYEKIGRYYRTFLSYGIDESKEGQEGDFGTFYETLGKLLGYAKEDGDIYGPVASEVAMEMKEHVSEFVEKGGIAPDDMRETLDEAESYCDKISDQMNQGEKQKLLATVAEAKKSIQILEDNNEKRIQDTVDSSVGMSDSGDGS